MRIWNKTQKGPVWDIICWTVRIPCPQVKKVLEERQKKWIVRYNLKDDRPETELRKFVLIEYVNWPFPLWENADEMEEREASWRFKEAYTLYKKAKQQGGARGGEDEVANGVGSEAWVHRCVLEIMCPVGTGSSHNSNSTLFTLSPATQLEIK